MTRKRQADSEKKDKQKNTRPTIGFLSGTIYLRDSLHPNILWGGVLDAAREQDVNLICFAGGILGASPTPALDESRNVLYNMVNSNNVDGLIISSGLLGVLTPAEEIQNFCNRYRHMPLVSLSVAIEGVPSVVVDNVTGLRDAISHLIEVHGHRRIAFIRGPEGHDEAEARYGAYTEALAAHGLTLNPDLVAPGHFSHPAGEEAMRLLLDERKLQPGVDFDAVVTSSDMAALGALDVLQARGIQVPYDVAVVGFDDLPEASVSTPALTTVRQPIQEQGRLATELLLALLAGEEVPEQITLPTEMVLRQSCGCLSQTVRQSAAEPAAVLGDSAGETFEKVLAARREEIVTAITQAVATVEAAAAAEWAEQLLDGFAAAMRDGSSDGFLVALDRVLRQVMSANDDVSTDSGQRLIVWQGAISALRGGILPWLGDDEELSRAEKLWQLARQVIIETAQRVQQQRQLRVEFQNRVLQEIGQAMVTTFDVETLMDVMARELPHLGIPSTYLALYEGQEMPPQESRLILAYNENGRIELEAGGQYFPSQDLVPEGLLSQERGYRMVVEALHFKDNQLGFVLLEAGPRSGAIYEALQGQISNAMHGALLMEQEEKRARQLQTVADVSTATSTILDTATLLQEVANLTKERFGLYHAHIYLLDDITNDLVLAAGAGKVGRKMVTEGWRIPFQREQSVVARAARGHAGVIVNNVREEPGWLPNKDLPQTHSELAVPLLVGERVLGVLDVQSDEVDHFTADDIHIQMTLATQVAAALENARLFEQAQRADYLLRERVKELDCLNDIGRKMEEDTPSLSEFLEWTTERIPPAMQYPDLAVAAIEFEGQVYGNQNAIELPAQIVHGLYVGGELLGRIYIAYTEKRDFIDEESALLGGVATRVSGFIENQRLIQQTEQRSQEMESVLAEVRQLAAIVENHPDFIGVGNIDGNALYVNPAGLKLMGLPLDYDVTTMTASDFFTAEDAEKFMEEGVPMAVEQGTWIAAANLLRADGRTVPVEVTISINYDIEGNPSTLSVTMHDITNRQVAEAEQARLLAEVEASYRQYVQQEWEQYLREQHQGQWHVEHKQADSVDSDLTWLQEKVMRERATRTVSHRPGNGADFPSGDTAAQPAAIVAPISLRGQVIGTLNLQDTISDRNWSDEEIALVESVSEQLALTVENLRLFDDTQRRATREQVTRQITDKIHAASDVDAIVQTGLTELAKALGVSRTYVKLNPAQEINQPADAEPIIPVEENVAFDDNEETDN